MSFDGWQPQAQAWGWPGRYMVDKNDYLLTVENLKTYFPIKKGLLRRTAGFIKAVDEISFGIKAGQTLGLVGESGCGKTTVARSIVRLVPAAAGRVTFQQMDVLSADRIKLRRFRKDISLIFQDPFGSLNPRMTVGNIIGEPLRVHSPRDSLRRAATGSKLTEKVATLLRKVGLAPDYINRYPHEFSGGQRQRIGIARALALQPKLIICDEPVSSLDVSVQSQILNLLKDLQQELGLTYLFIAHDLAVVGFFCDIVAVMYMGKIVEQATAAELYQNPLHPYTRTLLSAIPQMKVEDRIQKTENRNQKSDLCSLTSDLCLAEVGCAFGPRCPWRQNKCLSQIPVLKERSGHILLRRSASQRREGHFIACWKY